MNRRTFLGATGAAVLGMAAAARGAAADRPNILWITCEDISPNLGCYGDAYACTPNLDALARSGVRYANAFSHAPVCAPARSGIITGMYPMSLGSHNMRCKIERPPEVRCFTEYLREPGISARITARPTTSSTRPTMPGTSAAALRTGGIAPGTSLSSASSILRTRTRAASACPTRRSSRGRGMSRRRSATTRRRRPCRRTIRTRRRCARIGRATPTTLRNWITMCAACWTISKRMGWRKTPSCSSTATTARACRAASAGSTTAACACRCSPISRRSGGASRQPRPAASKSAWSASWISARRC